MSLTIALAGNQNCGKTTLYNRLTGSRQHTGNFPGVTVEKKEGMLIGSDDVVIVDLPGLYSLSPYSFEEQAAQQFLTASKPDALINIADATSLERSLYLTMQLMELGIPMVMALNMMDEVEASGNTILIPLLEEKLGIPVYPITATKGKGIQPLVDGAIRAASTKGHINICFYRGVFGQTIDVIERIMLCNAKSNGLPPRFCAVKLIENDQSVLRSLHLSPEQSKAIENLFLRMEEVLHTDREAALADARYAYIETLCSAALLKKNETKAQLFSVRIDAVLTHRIWGIPLFLCIMFAIFYLSFGVLGATLGNLLSAMIKTAGRTAGMLLTAAGAGPLLRSLFTDGILGGVGSVLGFLPVVMILFCFLSLLEDSGYMARVAFVLDKPLQKIGLTGRSFVPLLIGFGCSVPAMMATRTLPEDRHRQCTIALIAMMSCSAKLPVYALFCAAFFPKEGAFVMMGCYLAGILSAILTSLLLRHTALKTPAIPFLMELPAYRFPSLKSVLLLIHEKAGDFIKKTFTVILVSTVIIWFMQHFSFGLRPVSDSLDSILAGIGRLIAPLFAPVGFFDWRLTAALLSGIGAKESIISTLAVLAGVASASSLTPLFAGMLKMPSALSFLTFIVFYSPCVAALSAARRELGSIWPALLIMLYQTAFAWVAAFIVFRVAGLFL